ncbi:MAG: hypothetical protein V1834_01525 [Candidatus Micrarchaeota archaeon]
MTVKGHELVLNCQKCYSERSYGIRLKKNGNDTHECPVCKTCYSVTGDGFLQRV